MTVADFRIHIKVIRRFHCQNSYFACYFMLFRQLNNVLILCYHVVDIKNNSMYEWM